MGRIMQNRAVTFVLHLALIGYLVIPQWAFQFPAMVRAGLWNTLSPYLGVIIGGLYAGLAVNRRPAIYAGMVISVVAAAIASTWAPPGMMGRISFGAFYFLILFGMFGIGLFFSLCIRTTYNRWSTAERLDQVPSKQ
jgi:hypothetical protein